MPAEPVRPIPSSDSALPAERTTNLRSLRRALRRELRHRERQSNSAPISVFGFADGQLTLLASPESNAPETLLGLRVPDRFDAIAAVAASVMTSSTRSNADAVLAVAVTRDDQELCFLAGDVEVIETWHPQGWLVDACRRAVDLPTMPTMIEPVDLSLALWLDYLLVALVERCTVSWADAAAWCPVVGPVATTDPEKLGELLTRRVPSWSTLRVAVAGGAPLPVPVRADHAAWMDDAMFARWVLGFFPDLDDLRSDIEFLAPAEVAVGVERVVRAARRLSS